MLLRFARGCETTRPCRQSWTLRRSIGTARRTPSWDWEAKPSQSTSARAILLLLFTGKWLPARSLLPLLVAVAPIVPASRAHRAGHVAEGEDDAGVGAPWPPQDGRGDPDAGQLAPDEAVPRLLGRLRSTTAAAP